MEWFDHNSPLNLAFFFIFLKMAQILPVVKTLFFTTFFQTLSDQKRFSHEINAKSTFLHYCILTYRHVSYLFVSLFEYGLSEAPNLQFCNNKKIPGNSSPLNIYFLVLEIIITLINSQEKIKNMIQIAISHFGSVAFSIQSGKGVAIVVCVLP